MEPSRGIAAVVCLIAAFTLSALGALNTKTGTTRGTGPSRSVSNSS